MSSRAAATPLNRFMGPSARISPGHFRARWAGLEASTPCILLPWASAHWFKAARPSPLRVGGRAKVKGKSGLRSSPAPVRSSGAHTASWAPQARARANSAASAA